MKQAYYAVSDRGADFMSGARLDFGADENAVLSDLAYELPHAYHGNLEVGPRRYCLMKLRTGPLLFRTVPVAGVRRNLSFTHLLLLNQPHPLLEYLLGWEDPFWRDAPNPLVPSSQFDESLPWVSPSVKQQRDEEFRQWLADPAHEAWLRFAMLAHLTLPEDGRIFLPIKPIDVFEVVYGLARLLPHKLTESVTFSTYEHAPSSRNLRLIGTFTAVPDLAVRCGKDCVFGSSRDAMPAEPNAAALYLDRALSAWRRRPDALDTFLHRVCAIDSIERLSLLLRATDDPECLSNVELLQLVEDSIGRSMLANSPSLFERVLLRGTKEHAQRLASFVSRECKAGLLAHLAHRAGEAIRANDVRLLRAMLCGLDHVDPSRTQ